MMEAEAAHLLGFRGEVVDEARFAGVTVSAVVCADTAELQRRADAGLAGGLDPAEYGSVVDPRSPASRVGPSNLRVCDRA
jgi:hypothetical protein